MPSDGASFTDAWIETLLNLPKKSNTNRRVLHGRVVWTKNSSNVFRLCTHRDLTEPHNLGCNVQNKFALIQEWVVTDVTIDWTEIWQEQPAAP